MQTKKSLTLILLFFGFNTIFASGNDYVIKEIPANGIVIDKPGTYHLKKNIRWNPTGDGQAILITASNVTLDLDKHTLSSPLTQFRTVGIVASGVENLTIKNGTVAHMALGGIRCDNCSNILIKKITVDGLNLENTVLYTVPVGILVNGSSVAYIKDCTVKNISVKTGSTAAIQLTETIGSKVLRCLVKNLLNRDGACTGIGHLQCDIAEVKSCTINKLKSEFIDNLNTEGHTTIGIIPVLSSNILIENCSISNITGCCDDAHGMSLFECLGAVVKKCKVVNVLDGAGPQEMGAKATGIEVYASGVKVIECSVKNIKAINPQDKQATGFSCAQCTGVEFHKCRAENVTVVDQYGQQNASLGYGTGFGWAPDPRPEFIFPAVGTFYKDCTAKRCQVGFDSWYHIDSVWDSIKSIYNVIPILDGNQSTRTISCDACSECGCTAVGCFPTPRTVTISDIAANNIFIDVKIKE